MKHHAVDPVAPIDPSMTLPWLDQAERVEIRGQSCGKIKCFNVLFFPLNWRRTAECLAASARISMCSKHACLKCSLKCRWLRGQNGPDILLLSAHSARFWLIFYFVPPESHTKDSSIVIYIECLSKRKSS